MSRLLDVGVGILLPTLILCSGGYFLWYLRKSFLWHPRRMLALICRKTEGETSPLRALSVSLAGTLGVGNIVGVAVAMVIGGAGSLFWMWISALLSMILKYAEIVLAHRYKTEEKGCFRGGPMYYMEKGVGGRLGKGLAVCFSALGLFSAFSMGNMVQMNAGAEAMRSAFSVPPFWFGVISAVLVGLLLFGGFRMISGVTSVLIPLLSFVYLVLSLRVVVMDAARLPAVFSGILRDAFDVSAAAGGVTGFFLTGALRQGVAKGSFSHEAGCGTAPMAHAGADTKSPAGQGLFGIFEVFFDTIVLCSLTGFVILLAREGEFATDNGIHLVIWSFAKYYGRGAAYFVSLMIVCFAFATVVCWGYYGKVCLSYFTENAYLMRGYDLMYAAVTVLAAVLPESSVWEMSDVTVALMTMINLTAVLWLRREIREETMAVS